MYLHPFLNKDWEKYDVSRFVDVGCVSPEEGFRSIPISVNELRFFTIKRDLEKLLLMSISQERSAFSCSSLPNQAGSSCTGWCAD